MTNGPAWDQGYLFFVTWFGCCLWIAVGIWVYDRVHKWELYRRKDWRGMGVPVRKEGKTTGH